MRYVTTELEGYADVHTTGHPGISTHVLDTARNYRIVGTWRSEDYRPAGGLSSREQVRKRARVACDRANGVVPREPKGSHTCPLCGGPKSKYAERCMPCRTRVLKHGTHSMYVNKDCRCAACKNAHAAELRRYRAAL